MAKHTITIKDIDGGISIGLRATARLAAWRV